eukprot:618841-Amphidinium_carterae.1
MQVLGLHQLRVSLTLRGSAHCSSNISRTLSNKCGIMTLQRQLTLLIAASELLPVLSCASEKFPAEDGW